MAKRKMNSLFLNYLIKNEEKLNKLSDEIDYIDLNDINKLNEISNDILEQVILAYACLGEIGWCIPQYLIKNVIFGRIIADLINEVSIEDIDTKICNSFSEREIDSLIILTERKISISDKEKLYLSFELYLKEEYFACAVLLAGLIDSTSINEALKSDVDSKNISQCWKCYGKVIQDIFGEQYFSGEFPFNKSAKNDERGKATIEFFKSIRYDRCFKNKKYILISLSFALLKFFDDSDWMDKKMAPFLLQSIVIG